MNRSDRLGSSFEVREASLEFAGVAALREVNISVNPGEAIAFVGPSGSGKTSLLRLLCGWYRPTSGSVLVDETPFAELNHSALREVRESIGFVHQDLSLIPILRVDQNVLAGRLGRMGLLASLRQIWFPRRASLIEVHDLLTRVGIPKKLFQRTDRLSGGEQQRVAIARALYQEPRGLLADEPVSSVDPTRARDTIRLLTDISRERGLTLCVSLHNALLAQEFFPRLIGLRKGRVAFDRPTSDVDDDQFRALYELEGEGDDG